VNAAPVSPTIETKRLLLRRIMAYDAPAMHAMLSDAETMRYWSSLPHRSLAETQSWVDAAIAANRRGDGHDFAVLHARRVIGRVAFWSGNEVGFLFHRDVWGRGFAGEALGGLLRYGFEELGFKSARADVDPGNARSLRLLERLGFRQTGGAKQTFEIGGTWFDSVYLTLEAADFSAGRASEFLDPRP
jgi:RimJ/RimL family protein N-acetyltransferase